MMWKFWFDRSSFLLVDIFRFWFWERIWDLFVLIWIRLYLWFFWDILICFWMIYGIVWIWVMIWLLLIIFMKFLLYFLYLLKDLRFWISLRLLLLLRFRYFSISLIINLSIFNELKMRDRWSNNVIDFMIDNLIICWINEIIFSLHFTIFDIVDGFMMKWDLYDWIDDIMIGLDDIMEANLREWWITIG